MCDRCELDMLMFGEAVRHEPPIWEKGRFQARPVEDKPDVVKAKSQGADSGKRDDQET